MVRFGGLLAWLLPLVVGAASPTTTSTTKNNNNNYQTTTTHGTTIPKRTDGVGEGHPGLTPEPRQVVTNGVYLLVGSHHYSAHPGPQTTTQGPRNALWETHEGVPPPSNPKERCHEEAQGNCKEQEDVEKMEEEKEGVVLQGYFSNDDIRGVRMTRDVSSQTISATIHHKDLTEEMSDDAAFEKEIKEWGRWDEREGRRQKGRGRKRRHRLRHGKRRHERGNRELLDTDLSFGSVVEEIQGKRNTVQGLSITPSSMQSYHYKPQVLLPNAGEAPGHASSIQTPVANENKPHSKASLEFRSDPGEVATKQGNPSALPHPAFNHFNVAHTHPPQRPPGLVGPPGQMLPQGHHHHHPNGPQGELKQHTATSFASFATDEMNFQKDRPAKGVSSERGSLPQRERDHKAFRAASMMHGDEATHARKQHRNVSPGDVKEPLSLSTAASDPLSHNTGGPVITQTPPQNSRQVSSESNKRQAIKLGSEAHHTSEISPNAALKNSELFIDREKFKISVSKNYTVKERENSGGTTIPLISTEPNYTYSRKQQSYNNNDDNKREEKSKQIMRDSRYETKTSVPVVESGRRVLDVALSRPSAHASLGTTTTDLRPGEGGEREKHYLHSLTPPPPPPPSSLSHPPPPRPTSFPRPPPSPPAPSPFAKAGERARYQTIDISHSGTVERENQKEDLPADVFLQSMLHSSAVGVVSSSPQVLVNHEGLRKSPSPSSEMAAAAVAAAALTSSVSCYSTNDIIVVIFLTSLVNMVVFLVVTLCLCWCSLRGRLTSVPPRTLHPDDQRNDENDDEAEIAVSSEGCLEACLPDISYQRHIARGATLRPSFVMGRALRPLMNPNPPRLSHAVHELLHNLKTSPDYIQHKKKLSMSKRRSLSLENLALT